MIFSQIKIKIITRFIFDPTNGARCLIWGNDGWIYFGLIRKNLFLHTPAGYKRVILRKFLLPCREPHVIGERQWRCLSGLKFSEAGVFINENVSILFFSFSISFLCSFFSLPSSSSSPSSFSSSLLHILRKPLLNIWENFF